MDGRKALSDQIAPIAAVIMRIAEAAIDPARLPRHAGYNHGLFAALLSHVGSSQRHFSGEQNG
jgi:hypothetical protein